MRGVRPSTSFESTSAPASSSARTCSSFPVRTEVMTASISAAACWAFSACSLFDPAVPAAVPFGRGASAPTALSLLLTLGGFITGSMPSAPRCPVCVSQSRATVRQLPQRCKTPPTRTHQRTHPSRSRGTMVGRALGYTTSIDWYRGTGNRYRTQVEGSPKHS
jgi:hypothetical protein